MLTPRPRGKSDCGAISRVLEATSLHGILVKVCVFVEAIWLTKSHHVFNLCLFAHCFPVLGGRRARMSSAAEKDDDEDEDYEEREADAYADEGPADHDEG